MKKRVTQSRKKNSVWVFRSGGRLTQATVEKTIRKEREKGCLDGDEMIKRTRK